MTVNESRDGLFPTDQQETVRVLHVDDEAEFGGMVKSYLEALDDDMTVITETDARAAHRHLRTEPIDAIVSDYQMPDIDGIEFLRTVREEYPNIPFILFTGQGSETVASEAINAGVTTYVKKTGTESLELLVKQIQNAVGRRRSERQAKVANDRLLELYEQTDGFYILDSEWRITYWNEEIARRTCRPPEDVIGTRLWSEFPDAAETELYDEFQTAMETKEPAEFEIELESHGYWAEVRAYPVSEGLFIHSRDITDKREREREIERRNHILESFANTVSHDLRNPLSVAEGRLELAQQTGDFEHLEEVAKAHNRMRNLIDELLRVARGENLELSEVTLRESATNAWGTISADETTLEIVDSQALQAHESQLRRLFENVFWNAVDHGDADVIRVGTYESGIFVADDGTGIPESERETVFETGFSTDEESPGYGLSIVSGIVQNHEWAITVTESRDGGARFEIDVEGR